MHVTMIQKILGAGVFAAALFAASGQPAEARFYDPSLATAPSQVEEVACRTVRSRVTTRSGRVIYRTSRVCGTSGRVHRAHDHCRTIRERTVRPNGSVVYRTVRRCR